MLQISRSKPLGKFDSGWRRRRRRRNWIYIHMIKVYCLTNSKIFDFISEMSGKQCVDL